MTDCRCNTGHMCDIHRGSAVTNIGCVTGGSPTPKQTLADRLKDRKNYHDSEEVLMSPNSIDDMPMDGLALQHPTPEQIDHDIIGELSRLWQKVAELENNKKFYEDIAKDIAKRLNEAEDKLEAIEEQFLHFIELRKIKGTG